MRAAKKFAVATFILTFLVIIAGAVVRTTQSGMGCPDWPRCFGKWVPPTTVADLPSDFEKYLGKQDIDHTFNAYHTWIEYVNRLLGALLGLFAVVQLFLFYNKRKEAPKAYRFAALFLATVILTGLFGAVVVKLNLAHASISVHLLFAIVLIQLQLAALLYLYGKAGQLFVPITIIYALLVLMLLIATQSLLGTLVRTHIDDVSKKLAYVQRDKWLSDAPIAFIIHRSFSWLVLLSSLLYAWHCRNIPALKNKAYLLATIIMCSMITGIILFYLSMPAVAQPVHLLLATFAITQSFNILLQVNTKQTG